MTCPLSYQYCNRRFHYFSNPPGVWVENNYAVANLFPICVGLTTRQPYTTEDGTPYCSLTGCPVGESCKEKNSCQATPHPIVMGTGNKYLIESDVSTAGMVFNRTYNTSNTVPDVSAFQEGSRTLAPSKNGKGWSVSYRSQIKRGNAGSATVGWALRADGRLYTYRFVGAAWVGDADVPDRLTELKDGSGKRTGWKYFVARSENTETYDAAGNLLSIKDRSGLSQTIHYSDGTDGAASGNGGFVLDTNGNPTSVVLPAGLLLRVADSSGRNLTFGYDEFSRPIRLADPAGNVIAYAYDANNNLALVTYPDGSVKQYHYENTTYKNALTGITDERGVRYITYTYGANGKAVGEVLAGGVGSYGLTFGTNTTTVTDPLGTQRTYNFQTILGVMKSNGQSQPGGSGCGAAAEAMTYDANGNVSSKADFNGKKTTYAYDLTRNLETSRTEGLNSAGAALPETRTITTGWHATWRLPVQVNEYAGASAAGNPLRRTSIAYDSKGNIVSRSVTDVAAGLTQTWTTAYTYSAAVPGLILQKVEDGPRTDVTDTVTTEYYPHDEVCAGAGTGTGRDKGCRGQVKRVTNALGQVTQFTRYNAHGQAEEIVDPNGVLTTLTYDLRQRLTSRATAGETTSFQYDGVGSLTRLTQPDGSYIAYTYDNARRLTQIADNLGNTIAYTLDAAGNRTQEAIRDPQGALVKTLSRAYDALGRLQTLTGVGND